MYRGFQTGMMALPEISGTAGSGGGMTTLAPFDAGGGGKEKKGKPATKEEYDFTPELKALSGQKMAYDNDTPVNIAKRVAAEMGISPRVLLSSAWVEGMNRAVTENSSTTSDVYDQLFNDPKIGYDKKRFPVDGYQYYGTDTIGDKWESVKKYLPKGFEQNMQFYNSGNENGDPITTAAFNTNENALKAKAALMRYENDNLQEYAKKKGVQLDNDSADYFMMAAYNGGQGTAQKMIDEYAKDPDKAGFIKEGRTSMRKAHRNVSQRTKLFSTADELLNAQK